MSKGRRQMKNNRERSSETQKIEIRRNKYNKREIRKNKELKAERMKERTALAVLIMQVRSVKKAKA